MTTSAIGSLLTALFLGAMLAASVPAAADPMTETISKHSDTALEKKVRDRFQSHWTTSQVANRIRVGVKDGVATLTGELDTWDERLEAGRVAFGTEGVWKVQNQLTVKGYDYDWERWEDEAPDYYEDPLPNVG